MNMPVEDDENDKRHKSTDGAVHAHHEPGGHAKKRFAIEAIESNMKRTRSTMQAAKTRTQTQSCMRSPQQETVPR